MNDGPDPSDIYACYRDDISKNNIEKEDKQVTLGITEDRRDNTSQLDLAYVKISDQKVLTAFDNASTSTLQLRELMEEGKI